MESMACFLMMRALANGDLAVVHLVSLALRAQHWLMLPVRASHQDE